MSSIYHISVYIYGLCVQSDAVTALWTEVGRLLWNHERELRPALDALNSIGSRQTARTSSAPTSTPPQSLLPAGCQLVEDPNAKQLAPSHLLGIDPPAHWPPALADVLLALRGSLLFFVLSCLNSALDHFAMFELLSAAQTGCRSSGCVWWLRATARSPSTTWRHLWA